MSYSLSAHMNKAYQALGHMPCLPPMFPVCQTQPAGSHICHDGFQSSFAHISRLQFIPSDWEALTCSTSVYVGGTLLFSILDGSTVIVCHGSQNRLHTLNF